MKITEARVVAAVTKYKYLMDLEEWELTVGFSKRNTSYYAKTCPDPDYLKADIKFNLHRMTNADILRKTVLHELAHVWLSPYTQVAKLLSGKKARSTLHSLEETLVTRFERWEAWTK